MKVLASTNLKKMEPKLVLLEVAKHFCVFLSFHIGCEV